MSLNRKKELRKVAKIVCRDLRKNSTMAEIIFWEAVRNKKLNGKKFYRQHPLFYDITGKESFFVADFYCHQEKLAIELDGRYHEYRLNVDTERTEILNNLGLKVLRFKNEDVINNLNDVLTKVNNHFQ
jgi:very-short-patch-repair endonuclease